MNSLHTVLYGGVSSCDTEQPLSHKCERITFVRIAVIKIPNSCLQVALPKASDQMPKNQHVKSKFPQFSELNLTSNQMKLLQSRLTSFGKSLSGAANMLNVQ